MVPANSSNLAPRILTVVLTGGIASGKSAISKLFEKLGTPVIDTDLVAREVVQPGSPALSAIEKEFGHKFLLAEGNLDRAKMRNIIFSDTAARSRLEAILHPAIRVEVADRIRQLNSPYCILVIPLFYESSSYDWVDRVLVVDVPEEIQVGRVMKRDHISQQQAKSTLEAQASRMERLSIADDVIENTGSIFDLRKKVERLHFKYLELAERNGRA